MDEAADAAAAPGEDEQAELLDPADPEAARAEPDPPPGALPKDLDGVVGEFGGEVPTEARGEGGEAEVAPLIAYLLVFQTFLRGFTNVLFTFWRRVLGSIETDFRNYGPTNHGGGGSRQASRG